MHPNLLPVRTFAFITIPLLVPACARFHVPAGDEIADGGARDASVTTPPPFPTPGVACPDVDDADGDGLRGYVDPDCWTSASTDFFACITSDLREIARDDTPFLVLPPTVQSTPTRDVSWPGEAAGAFVLDAHRLFPSARRRCTRSPYRRVSLQMSRVRSGSMGAPTTRPSSG